MNIFRIFKTFWYLIKILCQKIHYFLWKKSPLIKLYQDNFSLVKHVLSSRDKNDSLPLDKAQKQQEKLAYMVGSKQQKDKNKLIFLLRNLEWTNGVMIKIMHNNIKMMLCVSFLLVQIVHTATINTFNNENLFSQWLCRSWIVHENAMIATNLSSARIISSFSKNAILMLQIHFS